MHQALVCLITVSKLCKEEIVITKCCRNAGGLAAFISTRPIYQQLYQSTVSAKWRHMGLDLMRWINYENHWYLTLYMIGMWECWNVVLVANEYFMSLYSSWNSALKFQHFISLCIFNWYPLTPQHTGLTWHVCVCVRGRARACQWNIEWLTQSPASSV